MKLYLSIFVCSLFLLSCNSTTTTEEGGESSKVEQLAAEVIGIHDEVMPKMEIINDLQVKLEKKKEGKVKAAMQTAIEQAEKQLQAADDAMMTWMREYKMPTKNDSRSEKELIEYLEGEKKRITAVKNLMLNSIKVGERWTKDVEDK